MSTPIITRPGFLALEAELDRLWRVERREVVQAVSEAAALGDRSENAETRLEPLSTYYLT